MSYLTTKDQAAVAQDAVKFPCRLASTGNVNLASTITTMDGVPLADKDRVLLKDQTHQYENGIYEWSSATQLLTRARDAYTFTDGTQVSVGEGATHNDTLWVQTTNEPIILDTTNLVFAKNTSGVITDHGALSGLGDPDHPQYQLGSEKGAANGYAGLNASAEIADATHGTRSGGTLHAEATAGTAGFLSASDKAKLNGTGPLTTSVDPTNIARQTRSPGVSTDAARADHVHDTAVAAAVEITDSTNAEGTSANLSRADHQHAHGLRSGGSLHSAATTSVSGFMSATDKTNIDDNLKKLNSTATVDPSSSQDNTRGYGIGSIWVNTAANTVFVCTDATTSAAVWEKVNEDHAARHLSGGADEIDGDQLDIDWNPANYTPATTPTEVSSVDHLTAHLYGIDQALNEKASISHAPAHQSGGADQIDGDTLDIDWNPSYYTPSSAPGEVTSVDELTAHLYGIDNALSSLNSNKASTNHDATHIQSGSDEIDADKLSISYSPNTVLHYDPTIVGGISTTTSQLTSHLYGIGLSLDEKVRKPASSTDNALIRFNGTDGRAAQNSVATLSDTGVLAGYWLQVDNYGPSGAYTTTSTSLQPTVYEQVIVASGEPNYHLILVKMGYNTNGNAGAVIVEIRANNSAFNVYDGTVLWTGPLPQNTVFLYSWYHVWTGIFYFASWTVGTRYISVRYRADGVYQAYLNDIEIYAIPISPL